MFTCIHRPRLQKDLYFSIRKVFVDYLHTTKARGIYAIYKDDVCLYVGMSNNMAGRLATHLSGKYLSADKIEVFIDEDNIEDLIPSEKWLIQHYKPMENLLADYSEKIDMSLVMSQFCESVLYSSIDIIPDEYNMLISVGSLRLNLADSHNINKELLRSL